MKKRILGTVILLALAAGTAAGQSHFPITHIPTIQVSGEGSLSAEPDRARLFMRVSDIRPSVVEAKSAVDQKAMQIQNMLVEMGIEKRHINASELLIHPAHQNSKQTARNYEVSRQITVTLEEIAKLDTVLDRSVAMGTNQIWQVELYSSREAELKLEAMRLAARDARIKAETLAAEFNRTLGKVHMAEYEFGGSSPVYRTAMLERGAGAEFSRGTIRIDARVSTVFEIH